MRNAWINRHNRHIFSIATTVGCIMSLGIGWAGPGYTSSMTAGVDIGPLAGTGSRLIQVQPTRINYYPEQTQYQELMKQPHPPALNGQDKLPDSLPLFQDMFEDVVK